MTRWATAILWGIAEVTWHQFRYHFDGEVERAMRYSIHEAMRRQCRQAGGGTTEGIAEDAIETFKRKMEKQTGRPLPPAERGGGR